MVKLRLRNFPHTRKGEFHDGPAISVVFINISDLHKSTVK